MWEACVKMVCRYSPATCWLHSIFYGRHRACQNHIFSGTKWRTFLATAILARIGLGSRVGVGDSAVLGHFEFPLDQRQDFVDREETEAILAHFWHTSTQECPKSGHARLGKTGSNSFRSG